MKVEISVSEIFEVFKEIQEQPGKILEMVRANMPKVVGEYLSDIMQVELTRFLGRKPYERIAEVNHRNGSYPRNFALKGIRMAGALTKLVKPFMLMSIMKIVSLNVFTVHLILGPYFTTRQ